MRLPDLRHLRGIDGREHKDEGTDIHSCSRDILPEVIHSQIGHKCMHSPGHVQGVRLHYADSVGREIAGVRPGLLVDFQQWEYCVADSTASLHRTMHQSLNLQSTA